SSSRSHLHQAWLARWPSSHRSRARCWRATSCGISLSLLAGLILRTVVAHQDLGRLFGRAPVEFYQNPGARRSGPDTPDQLIRRLYRVLVKFDDDVNLLQASQIRSAIIDYALDLQAPLLRPGNATPALDVASTQESLSSRYCSRLKW